MIDLNIFQLDEFQSEDLCQRENEKKKKRDGMCHSKVFGYC
jgi:hypothetical protein